MNFLARAKMVKLFLRDDGCLSFHTCVGECVHVVCVCVCVCFCAYGFVISSGIIQSVKIFLCYFCLLYLFSLVHCVFASLTVFFKIILLKKLVLYKSCTRQRYLEQKEEKHTNKFIYDCTRSVLLESLTKRRF